MSRGKDTTLAAAGMLIAVGFGAVLWVTFPTPGPLPEYTPAQWEIEQAKKRAAKEKLREQLYAEAEEVAPNVYRRWDGEHWVYWRPGGQFWIGTKKPSRKAVDPESKPQ